MTRGRRKDMTIPPSRALLQQRDYRARKAQYLADLEVRVKKAEEENILLRKEIDALQAKLKAAVPPQAQSPYGPEGVCHPLTDCCRPVLGCMNIPVSNCALFSPRPPPPQTSCIISLSPLLPLHDFSSWHSIQAPQGRGLRPMLTGRRSPLRHRHTLRRPLRRRMRTNSASRHASNFHR